VKKKIPSNPLLIKREKERMHMRENVLKRSDKERQTSCQYATFYEKYYANYVNVL